MQLRVIEPFGAYKQGDLISDTKTVAAVLASEQSQYVVKVADPVMDATKPADDAKVQS